MIVDRTMGGGIACTPWRFATMTTPTAYITAICMRITTVTSTTACARPVARTAHERHTGRVLDAFLAARVPDATARKGGRGGRHLRAAPGRQSERELSMLRWMVGTNGVLTLAVLAKLLRG
jgi:hypothetical protein